MFRYVRWFVHRSGGQTMLNRTERHCGNIALVGGNVARKSCLKLESRRTAAADRPFLSIDLYSAERLGVTDGEGEGLTVVALNSAGFPPPMLGFQSQQKKWRRASRRYALLRSHRLALALRAGICCVVSQCTRDSGARDHGR
jgi:hypothetical protein